MESEDFMMLEDLSCCVLRNFRGMLETPPDLNESVSSSAKHSSLKYIFLRDILLSSILIVN